MADKKPEAAPAETPAPPAKSGGLGAWLPLIVTLVAMPALAFATTQFLLVPKLKQAAQTATNAEEESAAENETESQEPGASGHGGGAKESGHGSAKEGAAKKGKQTVTLSKMVVNVAGTMGTRYLMTSVTLVGSKPDFQKIIEDNKDQLLDLANSTLSSKTIADLEKPRARNQIKTELISVINNALGDTVVKEIYLPEMAIQ